MRIIFGWNHFRIKAFAPQELGLPQSKEQEYKIEIRQRYFHLFWIPFFGIGKKWALRKGQNLYELPVEYEYFIQAQKLKLKTPWYTFFGPLLILLGFLIWGINDKIQRFNSLQYAKNSFSKKIQKLDSLYFTTAKADYYTLQPRKGDDKYVLLQVDEVKPKEIVFKKVVTGLEEYELSPRKIESLFSMSSSNETISVSKDILSKAVKREYETQFDGTDLFGDGNAYIVKDIFKLNGPLLTDRGTGYSSSNGEIRMEIMNYGWPGSLVDIKNKSCDIQWNNQFPEDFATAGSDYDPQGRIILYGKNYKSYTPYEFEIVIKDTLDREHRYNIKGIQMQKAITQLY